MKIPRELADFFEEYIEKNPKLGYRKISQIILHILQNKARELMKEQGIIESKEKIITLSTGAYSKEELQKIVKNMEE